MMKKCMPYKRNIRRLTGSNNGMINTFWSTFIWHMVPKGINLVEKRTKWVMMRKNRQFKVQNHYYSKILKT